MKAKYFSPKKLYPAICSECKKPCEAPSKPMKGIPIYCKKCYHKNRGF